ncbi:MAG: hypothetical protein B6U94_06420 [Thermofilum sp. ex4484_79]|nr:MAG: hypothetical protein B6U94_06420 [Thermofilum sp. ex4484_79]
MKIKSYDFKLKLYDPKNMDIDVKTLVYSVVDDEISEIKGSDEPITLDDFIDFDREFSNNILITFTDAIHGEFKGVRKTHVVEGKPRFILKVYLIRLNGEKHRLYRVLRIKDSGLEDIYMDRLYEPKPEKTRIENVSKIIGLPPSKLPFSLGSKS